MQKESEDTWISERFDVELSEMRILAQKSGWRGLDPDTSLDLLPCGLHVIRLPLTLPPGKHHSHPRPSHHLLSSLLFLHPHNTSSIHLTADIWQELLCSCEPKKSCCNISASPSATCVLCEHYASKQLQTVAGERNGALLGNRHAPLGKFLLMRSGLGITKKCDIKCTFYILDLCNKRKSKKLLWSRCCMLLSCWNDFISEMTCTCNGFGGLHFLLHET